MVHLRITAPHLSIKRARGECKVGGVRRVGGTLEADDGVWWVSWGRRGADDVEEEKAG